MKEASYYEPRGNNTVQCTLCPHRCSIVQDRSGICKIRKNSNGTLYSTTYGEVTAIAVDPIEKKPLYHFYPGSNILSIGSNGCNLLCPFCQNWSISTRLTHRRPVTVESLEEQVTASHSVGIAYTYNEPLISYEFFNDCAAHMTSKQIKNIIVSNGMINPEPLNRIKAYIDAANIDLKGFTNDFYSYVHGDLDTVKNTIVTLYENGTHIELTHLLIPTRNDDLSVFTEMCQWIASISIDIPLHISRYFPNHKEQLPPTPVETIKSFHSIAKKHLNFVYTGNVDIPGTANTHCPHCQTLLIERQQYTIKSSIRSNTCPNCDASLYFSC